MAELTATWTYDASHYPEPMTPLSAGIWFRAMGQGIQAAARELGAPFGGFETMTTDGGWAYEHELEAAWEFDPEAYAARALEVGERWRGEYAPRVAEITRELQALRPERGEPGHAAAQLDRLISLVDEHWRLHFLTVLCVHAAREVLHDRYVALLGTRDALEPYRLVEGLDNLTLQADELLWQVARRARELDVADVIAELPAEAALARLAATQHGREVLHQLHGYLLRFGSRSRLHELSEPRHAETPALALESVRLFLEQERDLPAERRAAAARRERLVRETLERIGDAAERERFARLLALVEDAVRLEEDHAYAIDYPGLAATREALLGFGRRLVAEGRLDSAADVFLLEPAELRAAVADAWGPPLQEVADARRVALAEARTLAPAAHLGPPPDADAEVPAAVAKFYGVPGSGGVEGDLVRGTGASAGVAVGTARVVGGREGFARLAGGDVLVCVTTTPAWTPLFGSLGGLVTDTGGILCHAAVVAREYGLPAVVGTGEGTRAIPDGARVEVNGTTGEVRLLSRASRTTGGAWGAGKGGTDGSP